MGLRPSKRRLSLYSLETSLNLSPSPNPNPKMKPWWLLTSVDRILPLFRLRKDKERKARKKSTMQAAKKRKTNRKKNLKRRRRGRGKKKRNDARVENRKFECTGICVVNTH